MSFEHVLERAATAPTSVGVFFDFDGTLSAIVDVPDAVVPIPGVVERVGELASRLGVVAIVSGRPVAFLSRFFDHPNLVLSGLYGLEERRGERTVVDPVAAEWTPVIAQVAARAVERFGPGVVEDKASSLTIHYRGESEEVAESIREWAHDAAGEARLDARSAKMSVELHPPNARSKGDAVRTLSAQLEAAAYFGDDVGDLPAFDALLNLEAEAQLAAVACVAVSGAELPEPLAARATEIVSGPEAVLEMLDQLVDAVTRSAQR